MTKKSVLYDPYEKYLIQHSKKDILIGTLVFSAIATSLALQNGILALFLSMLFFHPFFFLIVPNSDHIIHGIRYELCHRYGTILAESESVTTICYQRRKNITLSIELQQPDGTFMYTILYGVRRHQSQGYIYKEILILYNDSLLHGTRDKDAILEENAYIWCTR